jgi:Grx4 family monothiol glutaredoxin
MPSVIELTEAPAADHKAVLLFYASWHDSTAAMTQVLEVLASASVDDVVFAKVEAEETPLLSKKYEVKAVPTFILLQKDGSIATRIEGVHQVSTLTQAVQRLTQSTAADAGKATATNTAAMEEQQLTARLDGLIRSAPVMLFIKGSPSAPRCGFSRQVVELFQQEEIPFGSFDILADDNVRQGLKKHSDWPTYPQVYVHGELVGGLDILKEMTPLKQGLELTDTDLVTTEATSLEDRLKVLVNQSPVMLFMKGLPSAPRCGFSRQTVAILEKEGVAFGAFDILTDDDVREGLKTFSDWPTYPQLYVNGDLLGGLDIIQEMEEDGSLKEALATNA